MRERAIDPEGDAYLYKDKVQVRSGRRLYGLSAGLASFITPIVSHAGGTRRAAIALSNPPTRTWDVALYWSLVVECI